MTSVSQIIAGPHLSLYTSLLFLCEGFPYCECLDLDPQVFVQTLTRQQLVEYLRHGFSNFNLLQDLSVSLVTGLGLDYERLNARFLLNLSLWATNAPNHFESLYLKQKMTEQPMFPLE